MCSLGESIDFRFELFKELIQVTYVNDSRKCCMVKGI